MAATVPAAANLDRLSAVLYIVNARIITHYVKRRGPADVQRGWEKWIAKLQAAAEKNPAFAAWFEEFGADQEKLLRWDDVISEEDEE